VIKFAISDVSIEGSGAGHHGMHIQMLASSAMSTQVLNFRPNAEQPESSTVYNVLHAVNCSVGRYKYCAGIETSRISMGG